MTGVLLTDPMDCEQTLDEVRLWIRSQARPGVAVVVLHAQRNLQEYHLDEIDRREPRRIFLAQHGQFDLSGVGRAVPRGVVLRMLMPLEPLLRVAGAGLIWCDGRPISSRPLTALEQRIVARMPRN